MACMVRGEPHKAVATGLKSLRSKMDAIILNTKEEVLREKRAKEAVAEENARERAALNKKRKLLDEIAIVEKDIDKVEAKESYLKERMYFANQRFEENSKMKLFLERNKPDVGSLELTVEQYREKTRQAVDGIARMHKAAQAKEKQILAEEKRAMVSQDSVARLEEKLRNMDRSRKTVAMNYTPLTEREYREKVVSLSGLISQSTEKKRRMDKKADAMEKNILDLETKIMQAKKRNDELRQTVNELKGARV